MYHFLYVLSWVFFVLSALMVSLQFSSYKELTPFQRLYVEYSPRYMITAVITLVYIIVGPNS